MLKSRLIRLGVTFLLAPGPAHASNSARAYACARDVTNLVTPTVQVGPLFHEGALVFWSLTDAGQKPLLLVDAGAGLYAITLNHVGINRITFDLPVDHGPGRRTYFLSYLHDSAIRSRYFEFAVAAPPLGHASAEYQAVTPRPNEDLSAHLNYAIFETSENTVSAVVSGRLGRDKLTHEPVTACDHFAEENPGLAKRLRRNLDEVDLIAGGPRPVASRMPASVR